MKPLSISADLLSKGLKYIGLHIHHPLQDAIMDIIIRVEKMQRIRIVPITVSGYAELYRS
jgi:hypothetical protein